MRSLKKKNFFALALILGISSLRRRFRPRRSIPRGPSKWLLLFRRAASPI